MTRLFISLAILTAASNVFAAEKALTYKEAKAQCLKEKPELKGKALRGCVKEKELASRGNAEAKSTETATETSPKGK